jgi:rhomboid protease GluP
VINLVIGATIPGVSNIAHLGGLVGGLVFGYLMAPTVFSRKRLVATAPILTAFGLEALLLGAWYLLFV